MTADHLTELAWEADRDADAERFADLRRVEDENGSHIEPTLDETWDDLTKLRWHAAVLKADTGLTVNVAPVRYWVNGVPLRGHYCIYGRAWSVSGRPFHDAWTYINGISRGAELARQETARP